MMKLSFALFVLLQQLAGLLAQPYFISTVDQVDDSIGLRCGNGSRFNYINVQRESEVRFWLNRTDGVRFMQETDLGMLSDVTRSGDVARFTIGPELEGHYSCGVDGRGESDSILLISTQRGVQIPMEFVLESGMTASIPCPIKVGKLSACYYGTWYKDGDNIIEVRPPAAAQCGLPQSATSNFNDRGYILHSNFTLTIPNVAPTDSGTYKCEISVQFPTTSSTKNYELSVGQSLSVDETPTFIDTPEDFVVGADKTTNTLSSTATFYCTAASVPRPQIKWSYLASLTGQDQNLDEIANVNQTVVGMDESGRIIVSSTLVFHSLTHTDGGVVTCTAESTSRVGSNATSAHLTVLGAPLEISVITSLDGTILYEITLPVTLNRPTRLNFTYIDSQNPKRASSPNINSALMEFNNLEKIYHREDKTKLPFPKFHLNISIYAAKGSQIIQGPFITTSEPIDSRKLPPITVIGLAAGFGGFVLLLLPIIMLLALCCRAEYKKRRNLLHNQDKERDNVATQQKGLTKELEYADSNINDAMNDLTRGGKDVAEAVRERLIQIRTHINEAKSKATRTKQLVNRADTDCGEDLLTGALSKLDEVLQLLGEAPEQTPTEPEPASYHGGACVVDFKYNCSKPIPPHTIIEQENTDQ